MFVPEKGRKLGESQSLLLRKIARGAAKNDEKLRRREELVAEAENALHACRESNEPVAAVQEAEAEEHSQDRQVGSLGQRVPEQGT